MWSAMLRGIPSLMNNDELFQRRPSCTPKTRRTYLHAYSTDLDRRNGEDFFKDLTSYLSFSLMWNTYASVRFDMKNGEDIRYFKDLNSFNQSLYSNQPDPSLGYMDKTTGSDMFDMMKKFLKNTVSLCGSTIVIAAKRYPNEVEIEDLIAELQKNHVFVYILSSDTPSGGSNPSAMFNLATRTNGYCVFGADDYLNIAYVDAQNYAASPNQIVASKFAVSGKGTQPVPFKTLGDPESYNRVYFFTVFQDHKKDGSLISLNYTITDEFGKTRQYNSNRNYHYTGVETYFGAKNNEQYYFNLNYVYQEGRQEVMLVRMYSQDYIPDNWLPFNK